MPKINAENGKCYVYTFVGGLSIETGKKVLFALGHDLKFVLNHFEILSQHKGRSIKAQFDASTIKVFSACKNGVDQPSLLKKEEKNKINEKLASDILESHKFRRIYFEGKAKMASENQGVVDGELTLHGTSAKIKGQIICEEQLMKVIVSVDQNRFEIKPYSVFFGALKIKPIVKVVLELPLNALS